VKRIEYFAYSDIGLVREQNQDSFGIFPSEESAALDDHGRMFIVADGMGGHLGGEVASRMAVEEVGRKFLETRGSDIPEALRSAFAHANACIYHEGSNSEDLLGMGTTCSALVLRGDRGWIAHVGDSRVYRISSDAITQLTEDHSRVAELERQGLLTKEEARLHPARAVITRAMGIWPTVDVDMVEDFELTVNEYYLLCSDGLTNHVEDSELQKIVTAHPPKKACTELTNLALSRGGYDNITVIIVHVMGE
jgi:serine/threonine protein phosphatase PrpC